MVASVRPETVGELQDLIATALLANVFGQKELRALVGKLNNVARLVTAWRPFLQELYAALTSAERGEANAPRGTVWT